MSDSQVHVVPLTGSLRAGVVAGLQESLTAVLSAGSGADGVAVAVEFDVDGLEYLDGAAVQLLLSFVTRVEQGGGSVCVSGEPGERVLELLERVGAGDLLVRPAGDAGGGT